MSEFSFKLQSIAVAQILNLVGVDRIHHSAHTALVEISQEFLVLMVKKLKDSSNLCGRTGANYLDFGMILEYLDMSADDLIVYLNSLGRAALISKKQEVFKFPRIEPASFPIKSKREIKGEVEDVEMEVEQLHVPDQILPSLPNENDFEQLEELKRQANVPEVEVEEILEPLTEIDDPTSHFYQTKPFDSSSIPTEILSFSPSNISPKPKKIEMDKVLLETFRNIQIDHKKGPISSEDLLTMITFKQSYGVAIPESTTVGYETKSLINDLLLLRIPSIDKLFGGEKSLEHDSKVIDELMTLQKGRKKEKERDSGQGKAPIKMSAARIAKIREQKLQADIAAGRKPRLDSFSNTQFGNSFNSTLEVIESEQTNKSQMSLEVIKCICEQNFDNGKGFMISCDACQSWFHGKCVQVESSLSTWTCSRCN